MAKTSLSEQPLVVRAAVFVTFFNSWVMFEEFMIERAGLRHYIPHYRVGMFFVLCVRGVCCLCSCCLRLCSSPPPAGAWGAGTTPPDPAVIFTITLRC